MKPALDPLLQETLLELGLKREEAARIEAKIKEDLNQYTAAETWQRLVNEYLAPNNRSQWSFQVHEYLYKTIYPEWVKIPCPAFLPGSSSQETNLYKFMKAQGYVNFKNFHRWSVSHYREFWHMMVLRLGIIFDKPYTSVIGFKPIDIKIKKNHDLPQNQHDASQQNIESPQWFINGQLNIAKSCFSDDSSIRSEIAIITQTERGVINQTTYAELDQQSSSIARCIARKFKKGETLAILLPMSKDAIALYLGIVKAGCIVVSIAESFSPLEIAKRIAISKAKAIFTCVVTERDEKQHLLYQKVIDANAPMAIVLGTEMLRNEAFKPQRKGDIGLDQFLIRCEEKSHKKEDYPFQAPSMAESIREAEAPDGQPFEPICCEPEDYINILFSSGTSGDPKAIPWNHTTPIKCASDAHWHQDLQPGDVICWPTSLGWMMGPWLIFAALINKATIAIYEGAPTSRKFGQFVQDVGVTQLGVVPTLVRGWRKSGCMEGLDLSKLKLFTSTGECSHIIDMLYLMYLAGYKPIIEYCGGTEIGGGYITSTIIEASAPAAFTTGAMGIDFVILDEKGRLSNSGEVALIGPSVGLSTELLNRDHHEVYFADMPKLYSNIELLEKQREAIVDDEVWENRFLAERKVSDKLATAGVLLRRHRDHIERYQNGFYRVHGRMDDTMNISGIKVGSGELERILNTHPHVKNTAAVGVAPPEGGPCRLVIFAEVPEDIGVEQLKTEMQSLLSQQLNPLFKIHKVIKVDTLPRTESNKLLRRVLRDSAQNA